MTFIKITSRNKHDWLVNSDHIVAIVEHPFNDIYTEVYLSNGDSISTYTTIVALQQELKNIRGNK